MLEDVKPTLVKRDFNYKTDLDKYYESMGYNEAIEKLEENIKTILEEEEDDKM